MGSLFFCYPLTATLWKIIVSKETHEMATGTVKWFNDAKGYGFITPDGGGKDVFVHHSSIDMQGFRTLAEGERVQFELTKGQKGPQAEKVKKVE